MSEIMTKVKDEEVERGIDQRLDAAQWLSYKVGMKEAHVLLQELINMKSINKFKVEDIIRRAQELLHPVYEQGELS